MPPPKQLVAIKVIVLGVGGSGKVFDSNTKPSEMLAV